eukprot:scaffold103235_cov63-Phaeocystis_antarctica.AAC.2
MVACIESTLPAAHSAPAAMPAPAHGALSTRRRRHPAAKLRSSGGSATHSRPSASDARAPAAPAPAPAAPAAVPAAAVRRRRRGPSASRRAVPCPLRTPAPRPPPAGAPPASPPRRRAPAVKGSRGGERVRLRGGDSGHAADEAQQRHGGEPGAAQPLAEDDDAPDEGGAHPDAAPDARSHRRAERLDSRPREQLGASENRRAGRAPPVPSGRHVQQQQQQKVEPRVADGDPELEVERARCDCSWVLGRKRAAAKNQRRSCRSHPPLESGVRLRGVDCRQSSCCNGQAEGAAPRHAPSQLVRLASFVEPLVCRHRVGVGLLTSPIVARTN